MPPGMIRKTAFATLLFAAACGGSQTTTTGGGTGGDGTGGAGGEIVGTVVQPDPALLARQAFENPGGMWMPRQMKDHAAQLTALGIQIDPTALADTTAAPLAAIVNVSGCSASFVSPDGLVVTNHHCVQRDLQLNSTPERNLVEHGFLAKTRADELPSGPTQKVMVAQKITDITADIMGGVAAIADGKARHDEIDRREKALLAACEQDRPEVKCRVSKVFGGSEWQLTEYLEIRDVRLVYVPARSIGNYGGEIDNWEWPRHTGDFSFLRAYVGKDGKPADYSPDNVPFKPAAFLKVQPAGVQPHDLVFVTGYPGRTNRLQLAAELRRSVEWSNPRFIEKSEQMMALLADMETRGGETAIKAGVARQRTQNFLEKTQGIQAGLADGTLIADKDAAEKAFRAWAAADASRAGYVAALDAVEAKLNEMWSIEAKEEAWKDVVGGSRLLQAAMSTLRWSMEQQKPDAERRLGYQERDRRNFEAQHQAFAKQFDATIDRATLRMMMLRAMALPEADRPWLGKMLGAKKGAKVDTKLIDKTLDAWYAQTKVVDLDARMALMKGTPKAAAKSKDPFVKLALALLPTVLDNEARADRWSGELATLYPAYLTGLLQSTGGMTAPDANSTLRISYGTVRGYAPSAGAEVYAPFTNVTQIPAKNTGEAPFDAPKALLDAIASRNWGPYASADAGGVVPVNFLSDLDITNGNSGSAILNGKGELIGLAFDGNKEGLASDVVFRGERNRTIACDIRYALWVMDAVDGADHLLTEMGITPAL